VLDAIFSLKYINLLVQIIVTSTNLFIFRRMKYCLVDKTCDRLARRKNETGLKLCAMDHFSIGWGDIEKIKLNFKIRVLPGFFALLSVNQEFASKGLSILNTVITKNRDQPLIIYATCLSAAGLEIGAMQYFADLHVLEETDRGVPVKMNKSEWDKDTKILETSGAISTPVELIDFTLDESEAEELTDFEVDVSDNEHCSQMKKRKMSNLLSFDVLNDDDDDYNDDNGDDVAKIQSQQPDDETD
jgi:hypothetical protein